ncbi:alpha/beta fold hydrolase [Amnibacterium kyonggiense]
MTLLPPPAEPKRVMASDGVPIATYDLGDPDGPVVLAVHGFASSAYANWIATGWVRELNRAGYRVIAVDQRGHGSSGKPHDPSAYSMGRLVQDVLTVLDAYLVDEAVHVGYSLGARVGWHAALGGPQAITRAVLGGIPDGDPLTRFRLDEARARIEHGEAVQDRLTQAYLTMAEAVPGNDLTALVALVEGMRGGEQPDPAHPPQQPVLVAAGSEDPVLDGARRLAEAAPRGEFFLIPGRNHFNAPTAGAFRTRALEFLARTAAPADGRRPAR